MVYPSIDTLVSRVDSKYTLVSVAAKRARELMENRELDERTKPVTAALKDIADARVYYSRINTNETVK